MTKLAIALQRISSKTLRLLCRTRALQIGGLIEAYHILVAKMGRLGVVSLCLVISIYVQSDVSASFPMIELELRHNQFVGFIP